MLKDTHAIDVVILFVFTHSETGKLIGMTKSLAQQRSRQGHSEDPMFPATRRPWHSPVESFYRTLESCAVESHWYSVCVWARGTQRDMHQFRRSKCRVPGLCESQRTHSRDLPFLDRPRTCSYTLIIVLVRRQKLRGFLFRRVVYGVVVVVLLVDGRMAPLACLLVGLQLLGCHGFSVV